MAKMQITFDEMGGGTPLTDVGYWYHYSSFLPISSLNSTPIPTTKKAKALAILFNDSRNNGQAYIVVVVDGLNNNHPILTDSGVKVSDFDALFTFNESNIVASNVTGGSLWKLAFAIIY